MLVNILFYSIFFGLPTYLQTVRQVSEFQTGILMLSLGLCSLVVTPIAGRWIDKSGPRPALLVSGILMTLWSVWLVTLNAASPVISVCLALAAFGISKYLGTIFSSLLIGIVMGDSFSAGGLRVLGIILAGIALSLVFMSWQHRESGELEAS
jgi:MFS family permease